MNENSFTSIKNFLKRIPAIDSEIYSGKYENGNWWLKFSINITNELAWNVVQELGHVINYLSIEERLPTVFYPVSAPPYLNGGPQTYLYWIIESKLVDFSTKDLEEWLKGRLPDPVDNPEEWNSEE